MKYIYIHNDQVRAEGPYNGRFLVGDTTVKASTDQVLSIEDAVKMICGAAGIK